MFPVLGYNLTHVYLLAGIQLYENTEVKKRVANAKPYGKWFSEGSRALKAASYLPSSLMTIETLFKQHKCVCFSTQLVAFNVGSSFCL